jgi:chromate transporter
MLCWLMWRSRPLSNKWLSPTEMLDGLALAETTPGPLILVLVFVGFLAGFRAENGLIGGFTAGLITLFVTFLPSFIFIFLGAPFIENISQKPKLSGALSGITAAVVGVIFNLALWSGLRTLFKDVRHGVVDYPVLSSVDYGAVGIFIIACVLLFKFHVNLIKMLAVASVLGYIWLHV